MAFVRDGANLMFLCVRLTIELVQNKVNHVLDATIYVAITGTTLQHLFNVFERLNEVICS